MTKKRIGILTSGGDCPGLNCAIRAAVNHATLTYGYETVGIPYATRGLLERKASALAPDGANSFHGFDPLQCLGGTILGSINKGDTLARTREIAAGYEDLGLDATIAIGGDGSLTILRQLAIQGNWNLVAVPKTIDNDVALTQQSLGFDSAVNTVTEALERLSFTAASHDRAIVVEVMGRQSGHLALHAGIAGGADAILIPEIPYRFADLVRHIDNMRQQRQRRFAILVVAEGVADATDADETSSDRQGGISHYIARRLCDLSAGQIETRVTVLGHVQRGGLPSALDRIMAAMLGKAAVDFVARENYDCMASWQNGRPVCVPLEAVVRHSPISVDPDGDLVRTARALGTYIGEAA